MANMFASFNTGVSGLHSAQSSLNTTAHNLANTTTKGYTRQQVIVTDAFYSSQYGPYANRLQIGMGTDIAQIRQLRNTFLDSQYRLEAGRESFYSQQYNTVSEIEELFGELEGEEFMSSLGDLWASIDDLAEEPDNIVYRTALASQSSQFLERATVLHSQLASYQKNLNEEVQNQVNAINNIVEQIRDYSVLIRRFEACDEPANDYRDARNMLLDELGTYINFDVYEEVDSTITISTEGNFLLSSTTQIRLTTDVESETSNLLKPVWETGGDFFLRGELDYSPENNSDTGSLRGLLVARGPYVADYTAIPVKPNVEDFTNEAGVVDQDAFRNATLQYEDELKAYNEGLAPSIVMTVQAELDQLIHTIATTINDMFCPNKELTLADGTTIKVLDEEKAPIGDDAGQTMGTELFKRRTVDRYEREDVTVLDENGNSQTISVLRYIEEDPTNRYKLYSIDQLEVNQEILQDPSKIPLNANPKNGFVDGFTSYVCRDILKVWGSDTLSMDPNSLTAYSFNGYYNALVGQFAVQGNVWKGILDNQETTVKAINDERQNVMGVSTDEELTNLIMFQQCFNASSRYITVVDQMIEHLIERL